MLRYLSGPGLGRAALPSSLLSEDSWLLGGGCIQWCSINAHPLTSIYSWSRCGI